MTIEKQQSTECVEPVAVFDEQLGRPKMLSNAPMLTHGQGLYTSPPAQPAQQLMPWETRDRFYEALDRAVENVRQEMRIKTVTMRYTDYYIALQIIDSYGGHVLVNPPASKSRSDVKPWVGLTDEDLYKVFPAIATYHEANKTLYRSIARAIEAKLREKNA